MSRHAGALGLAACLLLAAAVSACREQPPAYEPVAGDFTVVLIPDTQYYMGEYLPLFDQQIQWIADNQDTENIVFAIHLGDMTNSNTQGEWRTVDGVMRRLDVAGVPWSAMPGNHDGIKGGIINSGLYNQYFGVARFAGKPWYGGHFGDNNDSNYSLFEAGELKFMVVSLAFGNPIEQLEWASEVIAAHPDRRVIFATHHYLDDDGTYLERGEEYGVEDAPHRWNDGQQVWDLVVRRHPNLFLTVCGHVPHQGRRESRGDAGNVVHEILANYQGIENGGDGYLRLLRFSPSRDAIFVQAYSPPRDRFWNHPAHTFTLPYAMP